MDCQNCGAALKPVAKFCQNCGAKVEAKAPVKTPATYQVLAARFSNSRRSKEIPLLIFSIVGLVCGTSPLAAAACFSLSDLIYDTGFMGDVLADVLAYAGVVLLTLVAPVACVLGVVFSAIARSYAADLRRAGDPTGRKKLTGKAKLGSILSIVGLIVCILSCLLMIAWIVYHLAVPSAGMPF